MGREFVNPRRAALLGSGTGLASDLPAAQQRREGSLPRPVVRQARGKAVFCVGETDRYRGDNLEEENGGDGKEVERRTRTKRQRECRQMSN